MREALLAKFTQYSDLRDLLLQTGEAKLVENSPYDDYWGTGKDGRGQNRLGVLLMQLRNQLRSEAEKASVPVDEGDVADSADSAAAVSAGKRRAAMSAGSLAMPAAKSPLIFYPRAVRAAAAAAATAAAAVTAADATASATAASAACKSDSASAAESADTADTAAGGVGGETTAAASDSTDSAAAVGGTVSTDHAL